MPPTSSVVDGSPREAVEFLAKRATDARMGLTKSALTLPASLLEPKGAVGSALASLGSFAQENPGLAHTLAGGAIGAGLGGVRAVAGNAEQPKERRRSVLGAMTTGGLAGAGIGAGINAARTGLADFGTKHPTKIQPGQFTDPATGQRMSLDPEAIKKHPGLADAVAAANQEAPLAEKLVGGVGAGLKGVHDALPISSKVLPVGMGIDAAMNNDRLRTGEWSLFGKRLPGMIDPRHSQMPEHLRAGIDAAVADPAKHGFPKEIDPDIKNKLDLLRDLQSNPGDSLSKANRTPAGEAISRTYSSVPRPKGMGTPTLPVETPIGISAEDVRRLRDIGARTRAEQMGKNKGFFGDSVSSQPRVQRTFTGKSRELPTGLWGNKGRLATRALGYGAVPLAETLAGMVGRQQHEKKTLGQILEQLKQQNLVKPVE